MARAKGLGSAHAGLHHWMGQKLTAIANIPLVLWAVWSFASLAAAGAELADVQAFFGAPAHAILMVLALASIFYHMALGLQVAIEDYSHSAFKPVFLMLVKLVTVALFVTASFSVLKMGFAVDVTDMSALVQQSM